MNRQQIFDLLNGNSSNSIAAKWADNGLSLLIILNVVSIVLESYEGLALEYQRQFYLFELFSVIVFTVEYLLRIVTADLLYPKNGKIVSRVRFTLSTFGIIDLLAILPFYLPLFFAFDLRFIRALRLLRLVRLMKLARHSRLMKVMGSVLKETRIELGVTFLVAFILLVVASTMMHFIEKDVQPESFDNIGKAFWWAIATLTTVGYGDVYPVTGMGKVLSGIIALLGICLVALPTGILSSAFIEKLQTNELNGANTECGRCKENIRHSYNYCPKCGDTLR